MKKTILFFVLILGTIFSFGQFSEKQNFGASELTAGDEMGSSVAIDGDNIAVGAYYYSASSSSPGTGCVFIFKKQGDNVVEQQQIIPSNTTYQADFGNAIDIEGDNMLVGAWGYTPDGDFNPGAAYFYHYDGTQWTDEQMVTTIVDYDLSFGSDVALSGNYAVIGAYGRNAMFLYKLQGTTWVAIDSVFGENSGDEFGTSVAIFGNDVFASSPSNGSGKVYYYIIDDDTLALVSSFVPSNGGNYGISVDYDGNYLIVGDDNKNNVHIYDKNNSWQEQIITPSDGSSTDHFGGSISISGNYIIVGSWAKNSMTGAAYIFENNNGTWVQSQKLVASNGDGNDRFGHSVAIDGYNAVVGAFYDNYTGSYSGSAYLFSAPPPPPPVITSQPQNAEICEGSMATFSVSATNADSYQWFKDSVQISDGQHFSGTTTSQLTVNNADQSHEGNYFCVVYNAQGTDTSNIAVLIVDLLPNADAGADTTICSDSVFLNAVTPYFGSGQWSIVSGSGSFADYQNPHTLVTNLSYGSNIFRWTVTSGACTNHDDVTVINNLPQITSQPADVNVATGEAFSLEVDVNGTISQYQWYKDFNAISNADQNIYTVSNASTDDSGEYYCLMQSACGQLSSDTVAVTVTDGNAISNIKMKKIYPNPADSYIEIPFDGTVTISDMQGKILIKQKIDNTHRVNIEKLAAGFYILKINNNQENLLFTFRKR